MGLELEIDGVQATTVADDGATFTLFAGTDVMLMMNGDGFREHHIYLRVPEQDASWNFQVANNNTLTTIGSGFGSAPDDTKAIITVAVRSLENTSIPGMTITGDLEAEATVVFSGASVAPGNTTLEGSLSSAVMINVDPGDLTATFEHDDDYTCEGPSPVSLEANTYVITTFICEISGN